MAVTACQFAGEEVIAWVYVEPINLFGKVTSGMKCSDAKTLSISHAFDQPAAFPRCGGQDFLPNFSDERGRQLNAAFYHRQSSL
jgi:hypothetical protein